MKARLWKKEEMVLAAGWKFYGSMNGRRRDDAFDGGSGVSLSKGESCVCVCVCARKRQEAKGKGLV